MADTEFKVEDDAGWFLNRETGETRPWDGIRILWRFTGERRWRRIVLVPDADLGQTVESLKAEAAEIVAVIAAEATG